MVKIAVTSPPAHCHERNSQRTAGGNFAACDHSELKVELIPFLCCLKVIVSSKSIPVHTECFFLSFTGRIICLLDQCEHYAGLQHRMWRAGCPRTNNYFPVIVSSAGQLDA